jgi:hypothetical protein
MKNLLLLMVALGTGILLHAQPLRPTTGEYKVRPDKYGLKYQEYQIDTEDGAKLNVWLFLNQNGVSAKYVLVSHDGQGNMSDHIDRVPLHVQGFQRGVLRLSWLWHQQRLHLR